jgi:hypothetical protein
MFSTNISLTNWTGIVQVVQFYEDLVKNNIAGVYMNKTDMLNQNVDHILIYKPLQALGNCVRAYPMGPAKHTKHT